MNLYNCRMKWFSWKIKAFLIPAATTLSLLPSLSSCGKHNNDVVFDIIGETTVSLGSTTQYKIKQQNLPNNTTIIWSSSNTNIAEIDQNGVLTPKTRGTFYVMAQGNGYYNANLTVKIIGTNPHHTVDPEEVKISGPSEVLLGTSQTYKSSVLPSEADQNVHWEVTEHSELVEIEGETTPELKIYPNGLGTITLQVTTDAAPFITTTKQIHISCKPREIFIDGDNHLLANRTYQFQSTVKPVEAMQSTKWEVSPSNMATIDPTTGLLTTGNDIGDLVVTAKSTIDDTVFATFNANIYDPTVEPTQINILGDDTIGANVTEHYDISVSPKTASYDVVWSINREKSDCDATIDKYGNLHATNRTGTVCLVATSNFLGSIVSAEKMVQIIECPGQIVINGPDAVNKNTQTQLSISTTPSEAIPDVEWTVDDPLKAYVSTSGVLTTFNIGTVKVTATSKSLSSVVCTKSIFITDSTIYTVSFGTNVGKNYTYTGNTFALSGDEYKILLHSTVTTLFGREDMPTHKEFKPTDIEVIVDGRELDKEDWSLRHNLLTIDARQVVGNIQINVLGAEIADWISWDTLGKYTSGSAREEKAKLWYQVGDYKMVTDKGSNLCFARVIDMYHHTFLSEGDHIKLAFTFEFTECCFGNCIFVIRTDPERYEYERRYKDSFLYESLCKINIDSLNLCVCQTVETHPLDYPHNDPMRETFFPLTSIEIGCDDMYPQYLPDEHTHVCAYYSSAYTTQRTLSERRYKTGTTNEHHLYWLRNHKTFSGAFIENIEGEYDTLCIEEEKYKGSGADTNVDGAIAPVFCL